ncbi:MAG: hypothetical protein EOP04_14325 [Proteobacteria bacterium]|nr:MAG: hypothetical protein EOP04_14325 [Pseudomonadota bacterium]
MDKSIKLHGAIVNLSVPCDWKFKKPANEKVLAMFTDAGSDSGIVIGALNYSYADFKFNKEELDYLLSDEELRSTAKQSGTYISGKRVSVNGFPTGEILLKAQNSVLGIQMYSYKCYSYIYTGAGTAMVFFTVQSETEEHAKNMFYARLNLFRELTSRTQVKL